MTEADIMTIADLVAHVGALGVFYVALHFRVKRLEEKVTEAIADHDRTGRKLEELAVRLARVEERQARRRTDP